MIFYFHPENWGRFPTCQLFFRWVASTTNQYVIARSPGWINHQRRKKAWQERWSLSHQQSRPAVKPGKVWRKEYVLCWFVFSMVHIFFISKLYNTTNLYIDGKNSTYRSWLFFPSKFVFSMVYNATNITCHLPPLTGTKKTINHHYIIIIYHIFVFLSQLLF